LNQNKQSTLNSLIGDVDFRFYLEIVENTAFKCIFIKSYFFHLLPLRFPLPSSASVGDLAFPLHIPGGDLWPVGLGLFLRKWVVGPELGLLTAVGLRRVTGFSLLFEYSLCV